MRAKRLINILWVHFTYQMQLYIIWPMIVLAMHHTMRLHAHRQRRWYFSRQDGFVCLWHASVPRCFCPGRRRWFRRHFRSALPCIEQCLLWRLVALFVFFCNGWKTNIKLKIHFYDISKSFEFETILIIHINTMCRNSNDIISICTHTYRYVYYIHVHVGKSSTYWKIYNGW